MPICERCATESPEGFRFCGACGAPLPVDQPPWDTRKVVTTLFCDIVDSTALGERLDPEVLHNLINRYFEEMRATIERHGGMVEKFAGDAVMAVFGIPHAHEDDALRAVRAAAEIRARMPAVSDETGVGLRFRTGVNTGLVLTVEGRSLAVGDAVNVAARLEQVAQPGEILLGPETLRLVRDAVEVEPVEPLSLKGKAEPVTAFRLLAVDPVGSIRARRVDIPLVGRNYELGLMRALWDRTVGQSVCHLVTILGAAGVGKSRLVAEFLAEVEDHACTLSGRCLPYGEGITFSPIVEALASVNARARATLDRLDSGGAATREELFLEVRRLLASIAAERPLLLHIDDLQWAEPTLLDLVGNIIDLSRGAPILLVCTARLELFEDRPGWVGGRPAASTVILEPLGDAECETLLDALGVSLTLEARAQVIRTSDGNPLFLQEMVEVSRERGAVVVPPTIHALLAGRLEGLAARDREILERGAVEGEVFHLATLRVLSNRSEDELAARLAGLVRRDLIRSHPATGWDGDAYRFRHLLIRDAAYERLPHAARADLHARFARLLEDTGSDLLELDEIAGWHLERAVQYRQDLGQEVDPAIRRRAADHLHAAGRRAAERSDSSAASNLLERALALTEESESQRRMIGIDLAERLIEAGELTRANELLTSAEHDSTSAEHGPATLNRLEWLVLAEPEQAAAAVEARLPTMLEELARARDDRRLAKAHMLAFWVHWASNQAIPAAEQARLAAEHAGRAGDNGLRSRALGWYVVTIIYGPQNAGLIARELDAIGQDEPGPYLAACVDLGRGEVERLHGHFADAHELTQRAVDGFTGLGMHPMAAGCVQQLAQVELSEGQTIAARESLLQCDAILAEHGERPQRATTQALLARVHGLLGATELSREALALSEQLSAPEDAINFAITHGVRARLALAEDDPVSAERWARRAVEHALRTDFLGLRAEAKLGLAQVLRAIGQSTQAQVEAREALSLFAAKGDRPGSNSAQSLLDHFYTGQRLSR
jgi:class 3 adenylate cyclase